MTMPSSASGTPKSELESENFSGLRGGVCASPASRWERVQSRGRLGGGREPFRTSVAQTQHRLLDEIVRDGSAGHSGDNQKVSLMECGVGAEDFLPQIEAVTDFSQPHDRRPV